MSRPLLVADNLSKRFDVRRGLPWSRGGHEVRAVDGVSFSVHTGETLGLVGESGCGKSTLARLLIKLLEPSGGSLTYDGCELVGADRAAVRRLRRGVQMVFQDPYASLNPRLTVRQAISEPLHIFKIGSAAQRRERVADLLALVGLDPSAADRYPHEFSGGQRQRVGIARALALEPRLVVCDEAVSALDVSVQAQVINLLDDLRARLSLSYVFISHDLAVVRYISTRVAVMYLGRIVEIGDCSSVFSAPRHPYTRALLAAAPDPEALEPEPPTLIDGDPPSPINLPAGCRFAKRCPIAKPLCAEFEPELSGPPGHRAACHFS